MESSLPDVDPSRGCLVAVELLLHVTRSDDNRLNGTVRLATGSGERPFSGTLELMRAFEELVPVEGITATPSGMPEHSPTGTSWDT